MVHNQTPQGVRYNNRYRGPHESKKLAPMYAQAKFNINKLKARLEELEAKKESMLEKPNFSCSEIVTLGKAIEETMWEVKK